MRGRSNVAHPRLVLIALGFWAVWVLATYLLEGRTLTLLRPEAAGLRLTYALVANVLVGVIGTGLLLHYFLRQPGMVPQQLGLRSRARTLLGIALGLGLGLAVFFIQRPASNVPAVIGNAFAQVWVVSVAEVLVCWVALGRVVAVAVARRARRWVSILVAMTVAAVAFGVYHFAHSPPFNALPLVGLLTVVGLVTGIFYFAVGELYGTIVFHNFLALKGVTDALAAGGRLEQYAGVQLPLIATALLATSVLVLVDRTLRRRSAPQPPPRGVAH